MEYKNKKSVSKYSFRWTEGGADRAETVYHLLLQSGDIKKKFIFGKVEIIIGKGKEAGYQHFLLATCFQKPCISVLLKLRLGKEFTRFFNRLKISAILVL